MPFMSTTPPPPVGSSDVGVCVTLRYRDCHSGRVMTNLPFSAMEYAYIR
jgi:hypothetical protein